MANNGDVVVLNCENCGEEFLYQTHVGRGSKNMARFCDNCKELKRKANKRAYLDRQKELRKAKRIQKDLVKQTIKQPKSIFIKEPPTKDTTIDKYYDFIKRISNSLIALDTIRVDLCEISKQLNEYQSGYDKNDQTFLHKIENINTNDVNELQSFMVNWQNSRNNRRNVKDLIQLTSNILNTIPYKNYTNALPILKGSAYVKKD